MIVITGRIPSKKNSLRRVKRGNRIFTLPSKQYEEWHEQASWQLKAQKKEKLRPPYAIHIYIYFPDKRKADLSNKAESIMDLLVDNGIIEDDNWKVVPSLTLTADYDKENPRAEVWINTIE
jgi:Holliday junction resolvase RusA-like endonuclease